MSDRPHSDPAQNALRLLARVCETETALSAEDIGRELALSSAAVQRLLRSFEAERILLADRGTGRLQLAPRFFDLARKARGRQLPEALIRPILRDLARASGETVTYNTYSQGNLYSLCALVEHSPAPLHYAVEVGDLKPLHAASSGRAILAHLTEAEIEDYVQATALPAMTALTITDPVELRAELARVKAQGYAMSRGHRLDGAIAISGSVFGAEGRISASLVLTTPSYRFDPQTQDRTIALVREAAARLSDVIAASEA